MKKRGMIVFIIVFFSTIGVYVYNSTSYCYGNKYMDNYVVQLNVRTIIAGPERRDVAFIKFRYSDNANHYCILLHRDGVLELTKVIASEKTFLKNVRTSLSPFDWHRFEITVEGSSIIVSVDDIKYLDIIDDSLSKGMIHLRGFCNARLAFFNEVKIFPI